MARYYFHLNECGSVLRDPEGRVLAGLQDVSESALVEARDIMAHDVRSGRLNLDCRIEVTDNAGQRVHHLLFEDALDVVGRTAAIA